MVLMSDAGTDTLAGVNSTATTFATQSALESAVSGIQGQFGGIQGQFQVFLYSRPQFNYGIPYVRSRVFYPSVSSYCFPLLILYGTIFGAGVKFIHFYRFPKILVVKFS